MLSIENFRKRYDDFELDCTMSVEPGQITGIEQERVRFLKQF